VPGAYDKRLDEGRVQSRLHNQRTPGLCADGKAPSWTPTPPLAMLIGVVPDDVDGDRWVTVAPLNSEAPAVRTEATEAACASVLRE
jgi:hypothetical protein